MIIQNTQWNNNPAIENHAFRTYQMLIDIGFKFEQRIISPYSTERYNAQQLEKAKKEKI